MRLKPQTRNQWIGLIAVGSLFACIACSVIFGIIAAVGPALSAPISEGDSRFWSVVSSSAGFLVCFFPSMIPFLAVGGWLIIKMVNPIAAKARLEQPELIVSKEQLRVGESFQVTYRQGFKAATDVEKVLIQFILKETATYRRGTNTYTAVHNHTHFEQTYPARHYNSGQRFEDTFELQIPVDGMHTFIANRNKLQWFIHVEIDFAKWPDYKEDFEVQVLPEMVAKWTG